MAVGGFDYDFIDEVSEELKCTICLQVFQDPNLTSCCGNRYCRKCIEKIVQQKMPCPFCQHPGFTLMLDKLYVRKVNSLRVKCPNGCEWRGDLGKVEEHKKNCQAKTVPCVVGCETMVPLSMLQALQGKDSQIVSLEQKVSCLQTKVNTLEDDLKMLALRIRQYPPVDLVMYNYRICKASRTVWHSDGFYTHPYGYKMCLTVYANGVGKGKYSHVSVFATLMKGEYDDDLSWPFKGHVDVELLGIESDFDSDDEEFGDVFKFNTRTPPRAKSRPVDVERNKYGHGNPEFADHDDIPSSVDVLRFRVTSVTFL